MKMTAWRCAGFFLLAGALSACASYEWRKEGASRTQVQRDEELCERHAQSFRQTPPRGGLLGPYGPSGSYGPPPGESGTETQRFISCMENRGYQRVKK